MVRTIRSTFTIWIIALILQSPIQAGQTHLLSHPLQKDLLISSTRAILESLRYELQKTHTHHGLEENWIKNNKIESFLKGNKVHLSLIENTRKLEKLITEIVSDDCQAQLRPFVKKAADETIRYLGLKEDSQFKRVKTSKETGSLTLRPGHSASVQPIQTRKLAWKGVHEYAADRLGPLRSILNYLSSEDQIVFHNGPFENVRPSQLNDTLYQLDIPISSWAKKIHLNIDNSGKKTTFITNFPGDSFYNHYQLLIKKYIEDQNLSPNVFHADNSSHYLKNYLRLQKFGQEFHDDIKQVNTLIFGYEYAFRHHPQWVQLWEKKINSKKHNWSADLYKLNKNNIMIIYTNSGLHGDILGKNIQYLIKAYPKIKRIFLGGSAGSLNVVQPYSLIFPKNIRGRGKRTKPNILSSNPAENDHYSVISPLEETPGMIDSSLRSGIGSFDMEFGLVAHYLKNLEKKHGIKTDLGAALLITDFPKAQKITHQTEFVNQDSSKKYLAQNQFAKQVYSYLTKKETKQVFSFIPPKKNLTDLSNRNLNRLKQSLKFTNKFEKKVIHFLKNLSDPIHFTINSHLQDHLSLPEEIEVIQPKMDPSLGGSFVGGLVSYNSIQPGKPLKVREYEWKSRAFVTLSPLDQFKKKTSKEKMKQIILAAQAKEVLIIKFIKELRKDLPALINLSKMDRFPKNTILNKLRKIQLGGLLAGHINNNALEFSGKQ